MKTTELSDLVVTAKGFLFDKILLRCNGCSIVGIHDWSDGKYNQDWRSLNAQTWKLLKETF